LKWEGSVEEENFENGPAAQLTKQCRKMKEKKSNAKGKGGAKKQNLFNVRGEQGEKRERSV